MLAGHYAASFVGRAVEPKLPLWSLLVAAQLVDLLWGVLVLSGVEHASLNYALPSNPLVAESMPYSHSLLGTAVVAALVWLVVRFVARSPRPATILALVVLSHWFLDLLMHRPDLTLAGGSPRLGMQLWNYPVLAQSLELVPLALAFVMLRRVGRAHGETRSARAAAVVLVVVVIVQLYSIFGPPPPNVPQMVVSLLVLWLGVPALAAWLERRRPA